MPSLQYIPNLSTTGGTLNAAAGTAHTLYTNSSLSGQVVRVKNITVMLSMVGQSSTQPARGAMAFARLNDGQTTSDLFTTSGHLIVANRAVYGVMPWAISGDTAYYTSMYSKGFNLYQGQQLTLLISNAGTTGAIRYSLSAKLYYNRQI